MDFCATERVNGGTRCRTGCRSCAHRGPTKPSIVNRSLRGMPFSRAFASAHRRSAGIFSELGSTSPANQRVAVVRNTPAAEASSLGVAPTRSPKAARMRLPFFGLLPCFAYRIGLECACTLLRCQEKRAEISDVCTADPDEIGRAHV